MERKFSKNFYWGTATSSHQIEGHNYYNDWWQAEKRGEVPESGAACDSFNRYEEDFELARDMHNNAHRLSIEWSRIEPEEGKFNEEAIEHYRKVIRTAKNKGLEPFVTLHHFTNPVWLSDIGDWKNKKTPDYFARYVEYVLERLGSEANFWITINEPLVYVLMKALGVGVWAHWPNSVKSYLAGYKIAKNFSEAHKLAYKAIKKYNPNAQVGVAKSNSFNEPYKKTPIPMLVTSMFDFVRNKWFLDSINQYQDFVGLNYYSHNRIKPGFYNPEHWFNQNLNKEVSDFGWELYPEGIYYVVKQASERYKKPIYIFENGIADQDDDQRPDFIKGHLKYLHKAIEEGADVRGYFHWSLLDNYEWGEGFKMKFGLVEVDFDTMERTPRESYYLYKEICNNNGL